MRTDRRIRRGINLVAAAAWVTYIIGAKHYSLAEHAAFGALLGAIIALNYMLTDAWRLIDRAIQGRGNGGAG